MQLVLTNPDGQDEKPVEMTPVAEGDYVTGKVTPRACPSPPRASAPSSSKRKRGV